MDEAVADADIITTCTADKQQAKVLLNSQVKPGVHLNAIGGDCPGKTELESEIFGSFDCVCGVPAADPHRG